MLRLNEVKIQTQNLRTGQFETYTFLFTNMQELKQNINNMWNKKIVKVMVSDSKLLFALSRLYPTMKVVFT